MHVIRHDDVPADKPMVGLFPRGEQKGVRFGVSQQWAAACDITTDELNDGLIGEFHGRQVRKAFAPGILRGWIHLNIVGKTSCASFRISF